MALTEPTVRWNLNIHYHRLFLRAINGLQQRALEVGCGDGLLSYELAEAGHDVLGIDLDAPSIERAISGSARPASTEFVCADFFEHDFGTDQFELVASNACLHHMEAKPALNRMKALVAPGGRLVIVSFGTLSSIGDVVRAVTGRFVKYRHNRTGSVWHHEAPIVWPPPMSIKAMEILAADELPGCTFDRLLSSRFVIDWTAPT